MTNRVRAKFRVDSCIAATLSFKDPAVGSLPPSYHTKPAITVKLQAVTKDESEENTIFGEATPYGEVSMTLVRESGELFLDQLGKEVYLDFSAAED